MSQLGSDSERLALYAALAVTGTIAAGALYYGCKNAYDYFIPYQYHYRPGTLTGWLAKALNSYAKKRRNRRPVRVYMDGCFDMMHFGHCNALRQAKALGDVLVVGLIPDSEILRCKGPPVLNEGERYTMVESVKWVDEVVRDVPYDLSPEFIDELFSKHKIDYIIHGDDPCLLPDGTDAYEHAKKLGRFKMIKRTEGVSTTDIVGRMLMCTRGSTFHDQQQQARQLTKSFSQSHRESSGSEDEPSGVGSTGTNGAAAAGAGSGAGGASSGVSKGNTRVSQFMPTSRRLVQFSEGKSAPEGGRIVYIDGAFDVFHPGHVAVLKLAKQQGDFLMVGLHEDADVSKRRGPHLPIMNLHERALSVLACKYVDEVIIGAPEIITNNLLKTFNVSVVVRGSVTETSHRGQTERERYAVPKAHGMYVELPSPSLTCTSNIIHRIVENRQAFEARNAKKSASETQYYENEKKYVKEV